MRSKYRTLHSPRSISHETSQTPVLLRSTIATIAPNQAPEPELCAVLNATPAEPKTQGGGRHI